MMNANNRNKRRKTAMVKMGSCISSSLPSPSVCVPHDDDTPFAGFLDENNITGMDIFTTRIRPYLNLEDLARCSMTGGRALRNACYSPSLKELVFPQQSSSMMILPTRKQREDLIYLIRALVPAPFCYQEGLQKRRDPLSCSPRGLPTIDDYTFFSNHNPIFRPEEAESVQTIINQELEMFGVPLRQPPVAGNDDDGQKKTPPILISVMYGHGRRTSNVTNILKNMIHRSGGHLELRPPANREAFNWHNDLFGDPCRNVYKDLIVTVLDPDTGNQRKLFFVENEEISFALTVDDGAVLAMMDVNNNNNESEKEEESLSTSETSSDEESLPPPILMFASYGLGYTHSIDVTSIVKNMVLGSDDGRRLTVQHTTLYNNLFVLGSDDGRRLTVQHTTLYNNLFGVDPYYGRVKELILTVQQPPGGISAGGRMKNIRYLENQEISLPLNVR